MRDRLHKKIDEAFDWTAEVGAGLVALVVISPVFIGSCAFGALYFAVGMLDIRHREERDEYGG